MDTVLSLIGRDNPLFQYDINHFKDILNETVKNASFLVIGGAGSIGSAVSKEIFIRNPRILHVVDICENNLVELVRDIRSSVGYNDGEFATYAIDCGSDIFSAFMNSGVKYDYVLNLSALKHVRSEKDPYTLMRMIDVNIFNTESTLNHAIKNGATKYFCVSTDKAANPVNMMGASKKIMEMFLMRRSKDISISTARFANVAFSDGSLLYGFNRRLEKNQPLSAPNDVRRYFVTPKESGELCLMSTIFGENRDIYFPKLDYNLNLITFSDIAVKYLQSLNYEPVLCSSEEEARSRVNELKSKGKYPVYFFKSDTTGEKDFEEFYTTDENLDLERYHSIGVIKNLEHFDSISLQRFEDTIKYYKNQKKWSRVNLIELFNSMIPEFNHKETGKFLDNKM